MNSDGRIAEQGLGPGRGDGDEPARLALDRVADVPEVAAHLALLDLEVADRRPELRVPVHEAAVAVDQALFVEGHEHLAHGAREALVHGEALARPVERGADAAELPGDRAAGFGLPLPDAVQERLAAQGLARRAFGVQQALDDHLGRDAGMVGAGLPERVAALHAPPADQRVLQSHRQGVADVQAAGDVGRRDHDGERGRVRVRVRCERAGGFPARVDRGFDGGRVEVLV